MVVPTTDEMEALISRLPQIDESMLARALAASGKELAPRKHLAFQEALDSAFRHFFTTRLWELWAAKIPPAQTARSLGKILKSLQKLVGLLEASSESNPSRLHGRGNQLNRMVLVTQANLFAAEIGGLPRPPARGKAGVGSGDTPIRNLDDRGEKELDRLIDTLKLWETIVTRAQDYEHANVTPAGHKNRHSPNRPLLVLFCFLNLIWDDAFKDPPRDGWSDIKGVPNSPYFRFLACLFSDVRANLDPEIVLMYPHLKRELALTPHSIRSRFRQTSQAKLPALLQTLVKKST